MKRIQFFLEQHDINTKIENGVLWVLNQWFYNGEHFENWEDASNWDQDKALTFLGYELIEE